MGMGNSNVRRPHVLEHIPLAIQGQGNNRGCVEDEQREAERIYSTRTWNQENEIRRGMPAYPLEANAIRHPYSNNLRALIPQPTPNTPGPGTVRTPRCLTQYS